MSTLATSDRPHIQPNLSPIPGPQILVVEDEYLVAMLVRGRVHRAGGQVLGPVATIAEAETLARKSPPHAAVLNLRVRGEHTFDLARSLIRRGCPVLFVSAMAGHIDVPEDLRGCHWIDRGDIAGRLDAEIVTLVDRARAA